MSEATMTEADRDKRLARSAHERYRDGYSAASTIDVYGQILKVLGVLAVIAGFVARENFGPTAPILGAVIGISMFLSGVFVAAIGQLLKATLDTAIHTSPFLTDQDRGSAMSLLRWSPAGGSGGSGSDRDEVDEEDEDI